MSKHLSKRRKIEKLIRWMRKHQPAHLQEVVHAGLLSLADATEAIQHGFAQGVFTQASHAPTTPVDRIPYELTGRRLRLSKDPNPPSFDALLHVWGIEPMSLPSTTMPTRVVTLLDADQKRERNQIARTKVAKNRARAHEPT
ncbi:MULTISPECIES: hypothetical protein [unclassified Caballeronia]|uniref:hypothetical protein n=1 Tax=unclassified Caballeronia TaxID=2646786 RepID=UPI002028E4DD|nr:MULTISPECIES: hypothetical protein [unclassified Caballeronia]